REGRPLAAGGAIWLRVDHRAPVGGSVWQRGEIGEHVRGGGDEVHPVGDVQVPRSGARDVRVPVLPDDPVQPRVDHDYAVAVVVVDGDVAVGERHRQRGMVEAAGSLAGTVAPQDVAAVIDDQDVTGTGVIGHQDPAAGER